MRLGQESVILVAIPLLLLGAASLLLLQGDDRRTQGEVRRAVRVEAAAAPEPASRAVVDDPGVRPWPEQPGANQRSEGGSHGGSSAPAASGSVESGGQGAGEPDAHGFAPRQPFRGRIIAQGGAPVVEPLIIVTERRNAFSGSGRPLHQGGAHGAVPTVLSLDADGYFEVPRREGHVYVVQVTAEGYAPQIVNLYAAESTVFTLLPPATIEGRVLDESTGAFVPDAAVSLQMGLNSSKTSVFSDEDGIFRFTGVEPGSGFLEVSHPLYRNQRITLASIEPGMIFHRTVSLRPGGDLFGAVVVEATGAPPGVPVTVTAYDQFRRQSAGSVIAAPDGTFFFSSLYPGGQYAFSASAEGFGVTTATADLPVSGQAPFLHLTLQETWTLPGVVSDESGAPVRGCSVSVSSMGESSAESVTVYTDGSGRFEVTGLGSDAYRVTITHPEFAAEELAYVTRESGRQGVQVTLRRGARIIATIMDAADNPIPGALLRVEVRDAGGVRIGPRIFGYTTSQGVFQMDHVPLGQVSMRVFAAGFASQLDQFLLSVEGEVVHRHILLLPE